MKSRKNQHRKRRYTRKQKGGSEFNSIHADPSDNVNMNNRAANKAVPNKAQANKAEPNKAVANKAEPNKAEPNKAEPNKAEPNKAVLLAKKNQPVFDCFAEGFDIEMREAAFGKGYRISVAGVHENGERWSYDETARRLLGGMVDWYRRTLEKRKIITPYTQEELTELNNSEVLKDLAVFYNRYKIVAEKVPIAVRLFQRGVRSIYTNIFPAGSYGGPESFDMLLKALKQSGSIFTVDGFEKNIKLQPTMKDSLEILASFKDVDFSAKDFPIEIAIDRAQCIIFYIVKYKGKVPPGFVMDERISRRAGQEVLLDTPLEALTKDYYPPGRKIMAIEKWLSFLNEAYAELNDPPVSFGLRWE